ncbi:MAG TPA: sigma-54 dependent transcriptional regulator [Candidatus Bathyarchaeia archaeon]|nr:sigma-54 dependent transcriptional regulator [Candidatus Bathyarchaeia archaeon]
MSENATAARVLAALPPGPLLEECLVGLRAAGHVVEVAGSPALALARVEESDWDLVLMDSVLAMPGSLSLLEGVKRRRPGTLVAMSGDHLDGPTVRDAFRKGAYDVLFEPVARGALAALVEHAVRVRAMGEERRRLGVELETERRRARELAERLDHEDPFAAIVTATPGMRRLVATMREVARSDATVLLTGESGTGKGLLARAIHDGSFRKLGAFVEANCVVYSEGVLNSELFGHEKGAFTGAAKLKRGRFELAAGGTLFLDEIGEISAATQLLLLRVLQDRSFERVGGEETLEADVRLVAATNRDLAEAIRRGAFREDLFYRLNVIPIAVPPLRERLEDVPVLTALFLARAAAKLGRAAPEISSEALASLLSYPWPGNVRELENLMERLAVLVPRDRIEAADLPEALRGGALPAASRASEESLDALERARILDVLQACGGNKKLAAARLGIHRSTLYAKLERYRR